MGQLALIVAGIGHGVDGATAVHDHPVTVFPAVAYVQDVAGLALKPFHIAVFTVARRQAEARGDVAVEGEHAHFVLAQHVHVVEERQIVKYHVVIGEADVVGQAWPGQFHGGFVQKLAAGIGYAVGHVGGFVAVVEEDQFARLPVDLGVG